MSSVAGASQAEGSEATGTTRADDLAQGVQDILRRPNPPAASRRVNELKKKIVKFTTKHCGKEREVKTRTRTYHFLRHVIPSNDSPDGVPKEEMLHAISVAIREKFFGEDPQIKRMREALRAISSFIQENVGEPVRGDSVALSDEEPSVGTGATGNEDAAAEAPTGGGAKRSDPPETDTPRGSPEHKKTAPSQPVAQPVVPVNPFVKMLFECSREGRYTLVSKKAVNRYIALGLAIRMGANIQEAGKGSCARVYLCRLAVLGDVAIKARLLGLLGDAVANVDQDVLRELEVNGRVAESSSDAVLKAHLNAVMVVPYESRSWLLALIVMPVMAGVLSHYELSNQSVMLAENMARPLLQSLVDYHEQGVVLVDISPSNIFLRPTQPPVYGDFSHAHVLKHGTDTVGEPFLMPQLVFAAPELLMGGAPSFKSDVYAQGMVFFNILCERGPDSPLMPPQEEEDAMLDFLKHIYFKDPKDPNALRTDSELLRAFIELAKLSSKTQELLTYLQVVDWLIPSLRWSPAARPSATEMLGLFKQVFGEEEPEHAEVPRQKMADDTAGGAQQRED